MTGRNFPKIREEDVNQSDDIIYEFSGLLIIFVTMAKAVVDGNRVLIREWFGETDFPGRYQDEVDKRLANNPLIAFVHDIRNLAFHYRLPVANLKIPTIPNIGDKANQYKFVLSSPELKNGTNGAHLQKSFLLNHNNRIYVEEIIDTYYTLVREICEWIFKNIGSSEIENF